MARRHRAAVQTLTSGGSRAVSADASERVDGHHLSLHHHFSIVVAAVVYCLLARCVDLVTIKLSAVAFHRGE